MSLIDEVQEQVQQAAEFAAKVADAVWFSDAGISMGPHGFLPYSYALLAITVAMLAVSLMWFLVRKIIVNTWHEDHDIIDKMADVESEPSARSPARSTVMKSEAASEKPKAGMKKAMSHEEGEEPWEAYEEHEKKQVKVQRRLLV
jgi:hypothetical protein